jgi:hypothetical protein
MTAVNFSRPPYLGLLLPVVVPKAEALVEVEELAVPGRPLRRRR